MDEADNKVWYDANCHCRRVKVRVKCLPLFKDPSSSSSAQSNDDSSFKPLAVWACNCSICTKNGYHNVYPDDPATEVQWISGEHEMTQYQYGSKSRTHFFCPTCGSSMMIHADKAKMGKPDTGIMVGINVSSLPVLSRNAKTTL